LISNFFSIRYVSVMRQLDYKFFNFCYFDCADITSLSTKIKLFPILYSNVKCSDEQ